jgi:hypothetical protein
MPVEDLPKRENPAVTSEEASKVRKELIGARDRQGAQKQRQRGLDEGQ